MIDGHRGGRCRPTAIASWRPAPIKVRRFDDYVDSLAKAKVVLDRGPAQGDHPRRRQSLAFAQGLELVEDEGLLEEVAGLVEWPVVLMGEFERGLPRHSARSDPRDDPRQSEMFRAASDERRQARQSSFVLVSNLVAARRRQGDRGRQRPGRARAALRRAPLLADRPRAFAGLQGQGRQAARPAAGQARRRSASFSTRSSARRASASSASRRWRASWRRIVGADRRPCRARRRNSPRPISSPRWSASSPNCRA